MNIIIITPDIYPFQKGYGGRNPLNLFEAFSRMGHATSLLTSVPDRDIREYDGNEIIKLFEIVKLHSIESIPRDFDYFFPPYMRDIRKIKKLLRGKDYDIIIINDYFWALSFLALLFMGKRNRAHTIMIDHGIISPSGFLIRSFFSVFSIIASKVFISQLNGILSYSKRSHNQIQKIVNSKIKSFIHPSCIDSTQFIKEYEKCLKFPESYLHEKFSIHGRFIFAIGAASPHKGYSNLINAFDKIREEFVDVSLVIAGQLTSHTDSLRNLTIKLNISNRVKFIGQIKEDEKFFMIRKSSLFVIPSLSEGFGAGAVEADILGVKVVATDTGAHRDVLTKNKFAKIVIPGDDEGLYNAMKELLLMPEEPPRKLNMDKLNSYSCESLASFIISMAK